MRAQRPGHVRTSFAAPPLPNTAVLAAVDVNLKSIPPPKRLIAVGVITKAVMNYIRCVKLEHEFH